MSDQKDIDDNLLDELLSIAPDETSDEFIIENELLSPLITEINMIIDQGIRLFTRAMLLAAPSNFWTMPSSKSGKYHPPDERGPGGNLLHTQRVVRMVIHMCDAQDREQFEKDIAVSAAILHDITKYVHRPDGEDYYDPFHPYTVDKIYAKIREKEDIQELDTIIRSTTLLCDETYIFEILRAVRCHLGPWSPIPETYPTSSLEWFLHFADTLSSHLHEIVDEEVEMKRWKL